MNLFHIIYISIHILLCLGSTIQAGQLSQFGGTGYIRYTDNINGTGFFFNSPLELSDKRIVLAGVSYNPTTFETTSILIIYKPDGTIQHEIILNIDEYPGIVIDNIQLTENDSILISATAVNPATAKKIAMLLMYTSNGELDETFGLNNGAGGHTGYIYYSLGEAIDTYSSGSYYDDGDIYLYGQNDNSTELFIRKYTINGALDETFTSSTSIIGGIGSYNSMCIVDEYIYILNQFSSFSYELFSTYITKINKFSGESILNATIHTENIEDKCYGYEIKIVSNTLWVLGGVEDTKKGMIAVYNKDLTEYTSFNNGTHYYVYQDDPTRQSIYIFTALYDNSSCMVGGYIGLTGVSSILKSIIINNGSITEDVTFDRNNINTLPATYFFGGLLQDNIPKTLLAICNPIYGNDQHDSIIAQFSITGKILNTDNNKVNNYKKNILQLNKWIPLIS